MTLFGEEKQVGPPTVTAEGKVEGRPKRKRAPKR